MPDVIQPAVWLETALICDAVRTEDNGKHFLIGVYGGTILVPDTPANLSLSAYFIMAYQPTESTQVTFRALHDGKPLQSINGELRSDEPGTAPVVMNFVAQDVQKTGEITLEMLVQDGEWKVVYSRPLVVAEDPGN